MKTRNLTIIALASALILAGCGPRPVRSMDPAQAVAEQTDSTAAQTTKVAHIVTTKELSRLKFKVRKAGRIVASECGDFDEAQGEEKFRIVRNTCEFGQRALYVIAETPLTESGAKNARMSFDLITASDCEGPEQVRPMKLMLNFEESESALARHILGFGVAELDL